MTRTVLVAAWLVSCRSPPSPHDPVARIVDASVATPAAKETLLEGCTDAFIAPASLDRAIVVVVLRADGARIEGALLDTQSGAVRRLDGPMTSSTAALHDLRVSGTHAAFDVRVFGDCAPAIGAPGEPVSCEEAHFAVRGSEVSASTAQVATGPDTLTRSVRLPDAWQKKIPRSCTVTSATPLGDALLFVHATDATCPFGLGGVITTRGAILVSVHGDENVMTVRASDVWYVGTGVDGKVERVRRARGDVLEDVAKLPSVATDFVSVGDRVIASTVGDGVLALGVAGWERVGVCDAAGASVQLLDDHRALFTCANGADVLDGRAVRHLAFEHLAHVQTIAAHDEVFATNDRGTLFVTGYTGSTFGCTTRAGAFSLSASSP